MLTAIGTKLLTSGFHCPSWSCLSRTPVLARRADAVFVTSSTLSQRRNNSESPKTSVQGYEVAYRFRYIAAAQALSRLKLYQTCLTVTAVPAVHYMYYVGQADLQTLLFVYGVAGMATVMLYIMSGYFRNLIGLISVDRQSGMVKVAHLTFWGRRKDIFIHVSDIVPLGDLSEIPSDVYLKFRTYTSPRTLYYSLRFGQILNRELLQLVFGRIQDNSGTTSKK